jgi:hypothetical protein
MDGVAKTHSVEERGVENRKLCCQMTRKHAAEGNSAMGLELVPLFSGPLQMDHTFRRGSVIWIRFTELIKGEGS